MTARALVIVDHGSRQPEAHAHLEWIAEQVRQRNTELRVYVAHMELASPSLEDAIDACAQDGIREVAVHPLFLVPGRHLVRDIPTLIERAAAKHPDLRIELLDALGTQSAIAELILHTFERSN